MDRQLGARSGGFTLIELMVVVAVLALLTTTVSLSVTRPRSQNASDAARFQAVHRRLRDQAVLSRQILGLNVDETGYRQMWWDGKAWQPLGTPARWRGPVGGQAELRFAPSGQVTPVRLRFDSGDSTVICAGGGWKAMTCAR
ncbi:MAG: prepilin-type N-terminal cleavage/methylation domain-containing protein [Rhodobacter sp.]|nr:prepilin-type N-terminal cleavage/methylation domain-containing protein [Rhodobacter sp.]